jgi:hypothetical protein
MDRARSISPERARLSRLFKARWASCVKAPACSIISPDLASRWCRTRRTPSRNTARGLHARSGQSARTSSPFPTPANVHSGIDHERTDGRHPSSCEGGRVMWAALDNARRWGAIGAFRLASRLLRRATVLHRQRRISHNRLRTVLSGALCRNGSKPCWPWAAGEKIGIFKVNIPIAPARPALFLEPNCN